MTKEQRKSIETIKMTDIKTPEHDTRKKVNKTTKEPKEPKVSKKVQKENPQKYPITTYDSKTIEPPDIKARLTNLNIPFTAFSYALTVVQSTYVKETGDMLTQYYNNKDKFMSEIDPIQFGKLLNAVETLETNVATLTTQVQQLNSQITGGKGVAMGLMITAGGLGAGLTKLLEAISK
jgi:hypothetical protein